jgi:hypothetical protein
MNQLTVVSPLPASDPAHDGAADQQLVELWLSMKTSSHTRRPYGRPAPEVLNIMRSLEGQGLPMV